LPVYRQTHTGGGRCVEQYCCSSRWPWQCWSGGSARVSRFGTSPRISRA